MTRVKARKVNSSENVQQAYFEWLCRQIDNRRRSLDPEYRELATVLNSVQFYDLVPNDDNRVRDGKALRDEFEQVGKYDDCDAIFESQCTVLEMLIALARRMDDILYEQDKGNQTARWFWLLVVKNLGLKLYSPFDEDAAQKREINITILRKFIERRYSESGRGGLFPLKNPPCNQKEAEIWYQMNWYIKECSA